jgi:hypothetical protein
MDFSNQRTIMVVFIVFKPHSNSGASPFLWMDVFKKSDGRSFIFPGFRTTWMLEIFDKMRHKDLQFSFGRKITRVVLWESQGGHSGTQQNDNVVGREK